MKILGKIGGYGLIGKIGNYNSPGSPLQSILDVFSTVPIFKSGKWVYEDSTVYSNDCEIDGNCLITNGATDYDNIPYDATTMLLGTSDFNFSARLIPISGIGNIFAKRNGSDASYVQFIYGSNGVLNAGYSNYSGYLNTTTTHNYGELLTVSLNRIGDIWNVYANGMLLTSKQLGSGYSFVGTSPISIGAWMYVGGTPSGFLNAKYESFAFSKRAWTIDEMLAYNTNGIMPSDCTLKKIYNQNGGVHSPDLSGNNNNGYLIGSKTWGKSKPIKPFLQINNFSIYKYDVRKFYNKYVVNTGKLAPAGWHIPTDTEWATLISALGGTSVAGGKMKESGTYAWLTGNAGDNSSGFSARGCGYVTTGGIFSSSKSNAIFWASNSGIEYYLQYNSNALTKATGISDKQGTSVRLIKDDSTNLGTLTDYDGNIYTTVKIGNQVWTTSEFRCTHYNDGELIPFYTDTTTFAALSTAGSINYNNELETDRLYILDLQSGSKFDCYGFIKLLDYTPLGFQKIPGNTITIPAIDSTELPAGDYTWQQIYDVVQSRKLIKTQDLNTISSLIVKKKITGSNEISILTGSTIFTENSILI